MNRLLCVVPFVLNASSNLCHQFDLRKIKTHSHGIVEQWTNDIWKRWNETEHTCEFALSPKTTLCHGAKAFEADLVCGCHQAVHAVKSDFLPFLCWRTQRGIHSCNVTFLPNSMLIWDTICVFVCVNKKKVREKRKKLANRKKSFAVKLWFEWISLRQ